MNVLIGSLLLGVALLAIFGLVAVLLWYTSLVDDQRYDSQCKCGKCD